MPKKKGYTDISNMQGNLWSQMSKMVSRLKQLEYKNGSTRHSTVKQNPQLQTFQTTVLILVTITCKFAYLHKAARLKKKKNDNDFMLSMQVKAMPQ